MGTWDVLMGDFDHACMKILILSRRAPPKRSSHLKLKLLASGTAFARTANKTIIKQVAIVLHILLELGRSETAQGCYVSWKRDCG